MRGVLHHSTGRHQGLSLRMETPKIRSLPPSRATHLWRRATQPLVAVAQRLDVWRGCEISPSPTPAHPLPFTLFKAQKSSVTEPREEVQQKRKVSEAEEEEQEQDQQRFAFEIPRAFHTWVDAVVCIWTKVGNTLMQRERGRWMNTL